MAIQCAPLIDSTPLHPALPVRYCNKTASRALAELFECIHRASLTKDGTRWRVRLNYHNVVRASLLMQTDIKIMKLLHCDSPLFFLCKTLRESKFLSSHFKAINYDQVLWIQRVLWCTPAETGRQKFRYYQRHWTTKLRSQRYVFQWQKALKKIPRFYRIFLGNISTIGAIFYYKPWSIFVNCHRCALYRPLFDEHIINAYLLSQTVIINVKHLCSKYEIYAKILAANIDAKKL